MPDRMNLVRIIDIPGNHVDIPGQRPGLDYQRVVTHDLQRARHPVEETAAVVGDARGLTVHQPLRANDLAAVSLADRLMSEANPEGRDGAAPAANRVDGDARLRRGARTWRDDHPGDTHRADVLD